MIMGKEKSFKGKPLITDPEGKTIFNDVDFRAKFYDSLLELTEAPEIVNYYKWFFDGNFGENIEIAFLDRIDTVKWSSDYQKTVTDEKSMVSYLQRVPGLYSRLCLWCLNNPFPETGKSPQQLHHIMPKFLIENYGFSPETKYVSYNIIKVDWLTHFILHLIRLIEWGQPEDRKSMGILSNKPRKRGVILRYNPKNRITSLCGIFQTVIVDPHWKTYDSYAHDIKNFSTKGAEAAARKRFNSQTINILTSKFIWQHKSYLDESRNPLQVIIPAHEPDNFSPKEFSKTLLLALPVTDTKRDKYLKDPTAAFHLFKAFFKPSNGLKQLFGFRLISQTK